LKGGKLVINSGAAPTKRNTGGSQLKRLGLFGGSFDPVHLGHLLVAQTAREELGLDRLFFVLAARSPFKPEGEPAPADERLRLLRLALAGMTWCALDDQEIHRGGTSYTIDTVRDYTSRFPGAELFYLIGSDHVSQLPKWRAAEELSRLVSFAVITRPGQPEPGLPAPFRGRVLNGFPLALSSSQVRSRVQSGLRIDHLVPGPVAEAIRNNRLYL
jgi:nicotinate-nucleotide adenylyltransferase